MSYLAIFQFQGVDFAVDFKTRAEAETYVEACAKSAGKTALKNRETNDYIIALSDGKGTEADVKINEVDTTVKYQLTYDKNDERIETSYYNTRKALITAAHKILDQNDFLATKDEDNAAKWSANNSERGVRLNLKGKLVVMGSDGDNVVSTYDAIDAKDFFANLDTRLKEIATAKQVKAVADKKDGRKKGIINLCLGAGIAALGGILTAASYNNARPGETYTVYTGLIAIGLVDAVIGLYYLINPKAANK